MIPLAHR